MRQASVSLHSPALLEPLLLDGQGDLYQITFFIGPNRAGALTFINTSEAVCRLEITPLRYDPYMNLHHLDSTNLIVSYCSCETLSPPTLIPQARRRSTSSIDFHLELHGDGHAVNRSGPQPEFDVFLDPGNSIMRNGGDLELYYELSSVRGWRDTLHIARLVAQG